MSKTKIVRRAFKFSYRDSGRATFLLRDESFVPVAESILSTVSTIDELFLPGNTQLLKGRKSQRAVFSVGATSTNDCCCVAKVCPISDLKNRLMYPLIKEEWFGFSEVANLLIVDSRGVNVPNVYGYGHIVNRFRLPSITIVILEDLRCYTTLEKLLKTSQNSHEEFLRIVTSVIPALVSLYEARCNNIEINLSSFLLPTESPNVAPVVLDFENAKFHDSPSLEVLMSEAASVVKWDPEFLAEEIVSAWLERLLNAVKVFDDSVRNRMRKRFDYYRAAKLYRKDRRRIG